MTRRPRTRKLTMEIAVNKELISTPARPNVARIYDALLGGKDNYEIDRQALADMLAAVPGIRQWAAENRQFLAKAVSELARLGIDQFIDIGSGLPTAQNTHEIALKKHPESTVVYVDYDPIVMSHARALLANDRNVHAMDGDLREPNVLLSLLATGNLIDFSRPVAILLVAVLHFIPSGVAYDIVKTLMARTVPGSYLAVSHGTADHVDTGEEEIVLSVYHQAGQPAYPRSRREFMRFFDGLTVTDHGITPVATWGDVPSPRPPALGYAGMAVKLETQKP